MQTASSEPVRGPETTLRRVLWLLVPCLVLVVFHVAFALSRDRPLIFADEAGYIGNARFLAGGLPIKMLKAGAYYPGYSLILAPLFWLGLDPQKTYQAILVVNGLLVTTAFVSLVYWLRRVLGESSRYAYGIAFAASAYPTFFVQPGFAMSESAVIALTTLLPLLVHWLVASKRLIAGFAVALVTAFLYSVHPRFIGTVAVVGIGFLLLSAARVSTWKVTLPSLLLLVAGVVGARALSAFVKAANGGGSFSGGSRAAALMTPRGMWSLTLEVLGQFWYLEVATAGLVLVGVVSGIRLLIWPTAALGPRTSPAWVALLFSLLTAALAFGVSCAFMSEPERVDHYIYGRYNEAVLAPVLALGIWELVQIGPLWRRHASKVPFVAAGLVATAVVLHWARGDAWLERPNLANILALIPYMKLVSGLKLVTISLVALGAYLLLTMSMRWRPWLGIVVLSAGFMVASVFAQRSFWSMQKGRAKRQVLFDRATQLTDVDRVSYDQSYFDPVTLFFGQYILPNAAFDFFESARGEMPKSDYILGSQKWPASSTLSAELIGRDKWGYSLWSAKGCCSKSGQSFKIYGAEAVDGIAEAGFYETEAWPVGPVRWTNGEASLSIPVDKAAMPTSNVYVDIAETAAAKGRIVIFANGRELFNGKVVRGRSRLTLPLSNIPLEDVLELKIKSDTFVPSEGQGNEDSRQLGIAIRAIRIVRECCMAEHGPLEANAAQ
jgi:hypothetical protein